MHAPAHITLHPYTINSKSNLRKSAAATYVGMHGYVRHCMVLQSFLPLLFLHPMKLLQKIIIIFTNS